MGEVPLVLSLARHLLGNEKRSVGRRIGFVAHRR
jgi:hypothetical protein